MKHSKLALSVVAAATSLLFTTHGVLAQPDIPEVDDTPIPISELYDEKVMPGIACEVEVGGHVRDINRRAKFAQNNDRSYLENTASNGRRIVCPIERDNTRNNNGTMSAAVTIYNPPDRGSICVLDSYNEFGELLDSTSRSTTVAGDGTLTLEPGPSSLDVSTNNGFYVLRCTVPDDGRIYSYRWAEFLRTDRNN